MPAYCQAAQFPVWERLPSEKSRRPREQQLPAFVSSAAIRLLLANGCRSKSGERGSRGRLLRQGLLSDAELPGGGEIHLNFVAQSGLRSFLVLWWSSRFPHSMPCFVSPLR